MRESWDGNETSQLCISAATLSASCSNYALCRTAVENEEGFGEATSSDLNHNFYEDDLIKSMEDLYSAKQLLKDVIAVLLRKIAKTRSLN